MTADEIINSDLYSLDECANDWLITFNALNTEHPPLRFEGHTLQEVNSHKRLGITLCSDLRWTNHIRDITVKTGKL